MPRAKCQLCDCKGLGSPFRHPWLSSIVVRAGSGGSGRTGRSRTQSMGHMLCHTDLAYLFGRELRDEDPVEERLETTCDSSLRGSGPMRARREGAAVKQPCGKYQVANSTEKRSGRPRGFAHLGAGRWGGMRRRQNLGSVTPCWRHARPRIRGLGGCCPSGDASSSDSWIGCHVWSRLAPLSTDPSSPAAACSWGRLPGSNRPQRVRQRDRGRVLSRSRVPAPNAS